MLVRAVFLPRVETSVTSTCIGLGLALLARVVRTTAVDILGKERGKVVLETLCFLQVELFLCLLYIVLKNKLCIQMLLLVSRKRKIN